MTDQTTGKRPSKRAKKAEVIIALDGAILSLKDKRDAAKTLAGEISEAQVEVLDLFDQLGILSHSVTSGNKTYKASRQQNTSLVYDETKLRKRLGAALWNKITTRTLDKKKLEAFVASKEVKVADLAACSTEKESAPFVKVT